MGLDNLNKRASDSFERLKASKGWTSRVIREAQETGIEINADKIQKMLDSTPPVRVEVEDKVYHINDRTDSAKINPMSYLDGLGLPANLTIAVAHILTYHNKGVKSSLSDAMKHIQQEIENG